MKQSNIDDFLEMAKSVNKPINYKPKPPELKDYADQAKNMDELSKTLKGTSDKQIKQENTGTGTETDASGKPIKKNGYDERQTESDSVVAKYTWIHDPENGNTYRLKKMHKESGRGRWISEPFKDK